MIVNDIVIIFDCFKAFESITGKRRGSNFYKLFIINNPVLFVINKISLFIRAKSKNICRYSAARTSLTQLINNLLNTTVSIRIVGFINV